MEHEIEIRVRYSETDQMGVVYHSNYFSYFEMGRTEMLRSRGISYKEMEEKGLFAVVVKVECSYRLPAKYDDLLTLKTKVKRVTRVKIEHEYNLYRKHELLAVGNITLAVIDKKGVVHRIPDWLLPEETP